MSAEQNPAPASEASMLERIENFVEPSPPPTQKQPRAAETPAETQQNDEYDILDGEDAEPAAPGDPYAEAAAPPPDDSIELDFEDGPKKFTKAELKELAQKRPPIQDHHCHAASTAGGSGAGTAVYPDDRAGSTAARSYPGRRPYASQCNQRTEPRG